MQKMIFEDSSGNIVYWKSEIFDLCRDTLVFLHGLTADHTMFRQQFSAFGTDYNIIAWDAPAHGESRPYHNFTYENASIALKKILDECKVSRVVLIGQSMGGFIAQSLMFRYPETAKAFVAIDSAPYGNYYSKSDMWWLRQVEWMAKLFPGKTLVDSMAKVNALTKEGQDNMRSMVSVYEKNELCRLMQIGYAGFL